MSLCKSVLKDIPEFGRNTPNSLGNELSESCCHQVHDKKDIGFNKGDCTIHSTSKSLLTPCTSIEDIPLHRQSSGTLSSGIFTKNSVASSVRSIHATEWGVQGVVAWLESNGLGMVVQNFIDHEIIGETLMRLDEQALKDFGISTLELRHRILNSLEILKASLVDEYVGTCYAKEVKRITDPLHSNNYHASSSLNSSVSSPGLETDQFQCNSSCDCKGKNSSDGYHINKKLSFSSMGRLKDAGYFDHTASASKTTSVSLTSPSSSVPPSPPESFCNIELEQVRCESGFKPEGWIYKQSKRFKTWNKRWFVLSDGKLFYFKNPTDRKIKGIIHLEGYRVVICNNKMHGFKLLHEHLRTFHFYTSTLSEMKTWIHIRMKSTIKRDLEVPITTSNTNSTISLDVAQLMKPRPPSTLMHGKFDYNKLNQQYCESIMRDVLESNLEEELNETLLWIEHPNQGGVSFEKLIIHSYSSIESDYN